MKIDTLSIKTITEIPKPTPPLSAIFALYDALAAVSYVVNLKPVTACGMRVIRAAA